MPKVYQKVIALRPCQFASMNSKGVTQLISWQRSSMELCDSAIRAQHLHILALRILALLRRR